MMKKNPYSELNENKLKKEIVNVYEGLSIFAPSDSADIKKKEVIAEPVSQEKDRVEFSKTKDVLNEFKQL